MLTALQASKEVGLSKEAILKAIKKGNLSAQKDGKGQWAIDPAELFRVYPAAGTKDGNGTRQSIVSTAIMQQELDQWRERCELLEKRLEQRDADVEDYRKRLDRAESRVTALLPEATKPPASLFERFTRRRKAS